MDIEDKTEQQEAEEYTDALERVVIAALRIAVQNRDKVDALGAEILKMKKKIRKLSTKSKKCSC